MPNKIYDNEFFFDNNKEIVKKIECEGITDISQSPVALKDNKKHLFSIRSSQKQFIMNYN